MIVPFIMRIGFDLDNVFISTPPIIPHRVIERLYRKKTNGELQYRIPNRAEQYVRIAAHISFLRPPIKKNLKILQTNLDNKHGFYLISSRFGFLQKATNGIVKKHKLNIFFSEMYFNFNNKQPHIFKEELVRKLRLDKFIDDDLHLLKFIASKNNLVKLYWLNKTENKKISSNITAITNLQDVFTN